ncbi:asparaginyl/glutamyl-tRNA amidotransferase subunit C [bacterium E08(2017)]|nr:asparaginyl/glutamyl-tRNA amidotransferase subunit C [bacterium E08(2017)]
MTEENKKIDVAYVAHLARMHVTDEECERLQGQMEQIVGYVEKIGELDLEGIEPTSHTKPVNNVFREDEKGESLDAQIAMDNAPLSGNDQFTVPKIIE